MQRRASITKIYEQITETYHDVATMYRMLKEQPDVPIASAEYKERWDLICRLTGRELGLQGALSALDPLFYASPRGPWRKKAYTNLMEQLAGYTTANTGIEGEVTRQMHNSMIRGYAEAIGAVGALVQGKQRALERLTQPYLEATPQPARERRRGRGIGDE
jgi:hypothetical protein